MINAKSLSTKTLRHYIGRDLCDSIDGPGLDAREWTYIKATDPDLYTACVEYLKRGDDE